MSRLECVRQTLRLALEELSQDEKLSRPAAWPVWWERYVESRVDYKSSGEIIVQKMIQAGSDVREALSWINGLPAGNRDGKAVRILRSVFEDNFEPGAADRRYSKPAQSRCAVEQQNHIKDKGLGRAQGAGCRDCPGRTAENRRADEERNYFYRYPERQRE